MTTMTTIILLIEDDPTVSAPVSAWLRRMYPNSHVLKADTAARAIAILSMSLVDLVVSDYDLGQGGTGDDVLRWARAQLPGMEDRFVFFTGSPEKVMHHRHVLVKGSPAELVRQYLTGIHAPATV